MIKNYIHSIIKLNHRFGIQPEYLPRFPTFKKGDYFWLMMLTIFCEFFLCYFLYLFYITLTSYQQLFLGSIVMVSHHCEIGAKYLQKFVEVFGLHLGPLPTGGMGVVFVDGFYFGKVIQHHGDGLGGGFVRLVGVGSYLIWYQGWYIHFLLTVLHQQY